MIPENLPELNSDYICRNYSIMKVPPGQLFGKYSALTREYTASRTRHRSRPHVPSILLWAGRMIMTDALMNM